MALALALLLTACSTGQSYRPGDPAPIEPTPAVMRHLQRGLCPVLSADASATVLAAGWAVTNRHAAWLAPGVPVAAERYDLSLFPITGGQPLPIARARQGDQVVLLGTGCSGDPRIARGTVLEADARHCYGTPGRTKLVAPIDSWCASRGYGTAPGLMISTDAGPGFSGGPIVNERGELVGIVQGLITVRAEGVPAGNLIFAYHASDAVAVFLSVMLRGSVDP